jgi:hypothetical protein
MFFIIAFLSSMQSRQSCLKLRADSVQGLLRQCSGKPLLGRWQWGEKDQVESPMECQNHPCHFGVRNPPLSCHLARSQNPRRTLEHTGRCKHFRSLHDFQRTINILINKVLGMSFSLVYECAICMQFSLSVSLHVHSPISIHGIYGYLMLEMFHKFLLQSLYHT